MHLNEKYRKFPIKFYKKQDGTIYWDCKFLNGTAKDMDEAFKQISAKDWFRDLVYYYDDVLDVTIGAFSPALNNRKFKGMEYLGQIELQLDIEPRYSDTEHSVVNISKNPDLIEKQNKYMTDLQRQEKIDKFKNELKQGFKKLVGAFQHEMFFPYKTRKDLICKHCGEIIPIANYYEEWRGDNYHIECIWDKLYNENKSNEYEDCREFFLGLQKLKHWPYNDLDLKDNYKSDLELVRTNDRRNKIDEIR